MIIIEKNDLRIRWLDEIDIPSLTKWLADPAVLEYYEGRDHPFNEELVRETFFKEGDDTSRCLLDWQGSPIGYMQYYLIDDEECSLYGYTGLDETIYGMDQFIGEPSYWNKGFGTQAVNMLVGYLIHSHGADRVVLDPRVENGRAIRCYEKCGFQKVKLLPKREQHEGELHDCLLMEYRPMS
ncbi:GNAT family N-acetyltransferase [Pullulanibacillus sp. KACC 23026]|uniref:GNAT family N-acetyltransferase n=1 Tax=Pullulanibacillus sp. KACC 23026 TaxID=3028315 RepID=UPI0023AFD4CA|nr:GNAT family N-acetyltransferase [Pullulanibacillus sp. KACC 23026]WEG12013.1 GNAT family N-acetyltransferase [Pullulanibacillus sp. KACC 23026]